MAENSADNPNDNNGSSEISNVAENSANSSGDSNSPAEMRNVVENGVGALSHNNNSQGISGSWRSVGAYLCLLVSGFGVGWLAGLSISPITHIVLGAVITIVVAIVVGLAGSEETRVEPNREPNNSTQINISLKWLEEITFNKKVNPFPITVTILGVCFGVSFGISTRTNDMFGINPDKLTVVWAKDGLEKAEVRRRIFDQLYPTTKDKFPVDFGVDPDNLVSRWAKDGLEKAEVRRRMFDQLYPPTDSSSKNATTDKGEKATLPEKEISEQDKQSISIERVKQISTSLFGSKLSERVGVCDLVNNREGKELKTKLLETNNDAIKALVENCNDKKDCLKAIKELLCPGSK